MRLFLLAAALAAVPSNAPVAPLVVVAYPLIHRVDCDEGRGTAFRVGRDRLLSVAHVTSLHHCTVEGAPIVADNDKTLDSSSATTPIQKGGALKINCEGFRPGQWYWSVGYANGADFQTSVLLLATSQKADDGERVLEGPQTIIPGMSGGPIMNAAGEVVGLNNRYSPMGLISLSRELKDTAICHS